MNNLWAGNNIEEAIDVESSDDSTVDSSFTVDQAYPLNAQSANSAVYGVIDLDPIEETYDGQYRNIIGRGVCKRIGGVMHYGLVELYSSTSEMFKVVYTNGYSEEMGLRILIKYLSAEHFVQPLPAEIGRNDVVAEGLSQISPAESSNHRLKLPQTMPAPGGGSPVIPAVGADDAPRQADTGGLQRSSRKRKQILCGGDYIEAPDDECQGCGDENCRECGPIPPIIRVPWFNIYDVNDLPPMRPPEDRVKTPGVRSTKKRTGAAMMNAPPVYPGDKSDDLESDCRN